jgi:putative membrane protein
MWDGHDGMGWWMVFGSVMFVLFWGLVAWVIYAVTSKAGGGQPGRAPSEETPLDIAKRRYARGEITKEQFDRIRSDLT